MAQMLLLYIGVKNYWKNLIINLDFKGEINNGKENNYHSSSNRRMAKERE